MEEEELQALIERARARELLARVTREQISDGNLYSRENAGLYDQTATSETPNIADPIPGVQLGSAEPIVDNIYGLDNGVLSGGEQVAAGVNNAGESISLGLVGDEANAAFDAAIGRGTYEDRRDRYRDLQEQFAEERPLLSLASEVLPAMAIPGGAAAAGRGLLSRIGLGTVAGAGSSGLYGYMEGEGGAENRRDNAQRLGILGGAIGGAIPMIGAGAQAAYNGIMRNRAVRQAARNAPTTEALRAEGNRLYGQIDDAGLQIRPQAFDDLVGDMTDAARQRGLDELPGNPNTPRAARNLQRAGEMSSEMATDDTAALPFSALDQYRRSLGPAAGDLTNNTESAIGSEMIGQLDDFVQGLGAEDVTTGDLDAVRSLIPQAREVWGRMRRSQVVDDAIDNAQNYLGGEASGLRNGFARILRNPRLSRGFSDAELSVMRRVVSGTFPERLVQLLGNGIGNTATVGLGIGMGAQGGPVGAALGGVAGAGIAALTRRAADGIASRNAERARAAVASGLLGQTAALPQITNQTRGLLDDALLRAGRSGVMAQQ